MTSHNALVAIAALGLLASCLPKEESSRVLAGESSGLPILVVPVEGDTTKFYIYTPAASTETGVNLCTDVTMADCVRGTTAKALKVIKVSAEKSYYASEAVTMNDGTILNLVALNGKTVTKSRSLKLTSVGTAFALDLPKEKQVFQRDSKDKGKIAIQFRATVAASAKFAKARVTGTAASNNVAATGEWQEFAVTADTAGVVKASIDAPAGGWFQVEVVLLDETKAKPLGQAIVKQVGVGEVFMIAGQSNSTNCGRAPQKADSDFVVSTDGQKWQRGDDPQLGTHDVDQCNENNGYGGSNWPITGKALVDKYKVPVAFSSTGFSGSAIRQWAPTGAAPLPGDRYNLSLFEYSARRAEQLTVSGVRAVLWHQGENDAKDNTTGADYEKGLTDVITAMRTRAKVSSPWLIAVASWCAPGSYGPEWKGASAEVTGAQQRLVTDNKVPDLFSGPSTDDLEQAYRGTPAQPQDCHFNDQGLKEVGKRWADKIGLFLDSKLGA